MPKMHGLLEKILANNAAEKKARCFHYCAYWGTWSRILSNEKGNVVEVNLTPINSCYSSSWENDVLPIKFRSHGTSPGDRDRFEKELPAEVLANMKKNLGEELTNRLLSEDFLPQIDVPKGKRNNPQGGGFTFAQGAKEETK